MSSNVFTTPRSITTIARGRIDHNASLQALLQNFASNAQPIAESVNLEGTTGLRTGMLWYKAGNLADRGEGRLLVYDGNTFTRNGIAVHRMSNVTSANAAAVLGHISRGDLVDVGDDRLYMVSASGTFVFDVGSLPPTANIDADSLGGVSLASLRNEYRANDGVTLGLARANDHATYTTLQSEYRANDGITLGFARANDGATLLSARANDHATYTALQAEYRANDGATLLSARANDHATYTTLVNEYSANDGATLLSARANDHATYTTLQSEYRANDGITLGFARANDGATLLSARANDYNTYVTLRSEFRANDGVTLGLALANDGVTLGLARANDHATYTALQAEYRANDYATWDGLRNFINLKSNSATPTFTGDVTIPQYIIHTGDTDTYFGFSASDTVVVRTAGVNRLTVTASGNVEVASQISAADFNSTSDITVKENVEPIHDALRRLLQIRGVTFNFVGMPSSDRRAGVIAQEVEQVLPEAVRELSSGIKHVAYGNLIGLLVEAIREQQEQINELRRVLKESEDGN